MYMYIYYNKENRIVLVSLSEWVMGGGREKKVTK
jgi:hypothetical protein